ncbi:MAG TPA: hypothetical protein ENI17_11525 [Pseudomonas xinjiangensis]|uniref:Lipoprotein n=2 Tax=root TaxID=1 RepID=A0A7V1FSS0_9GAMM|nr:hypothetical protein [Halopseudomonas xinjiangensis]HEC48243.1 hypothetical protein [Halopseudomonas xinjiangensis]
MKHLILAFAGVAGLTGCASTSPHAHLNDAYQAYHQGDCEKTVGLLSRAERAGRSRYNLQPELQPEISLLRGLCLERQALFLDAAQTYRFILRQHPTSEYSYRAGARLETLRQLGHYDPERVLPPERR